MASTAIIVIYLLIGCGAAIAVLAQRGSTARLGNAGLMLFLWPFLLPTTLLAEPLAGVRPVRSDSERARRLERLGFELREAWQRSEAGEGRERRVLEGFLGKLVRQESRLAELEQTIETAAISIRPKLTALRDATVKEIDQGLALLEEMVAQLTLLRFAGLAESEGADRDSVESLLARIEALANLTRAA